MPLTHWQNLTRGRGYPARGSKHTAPELAQQRVWGAVYPKQHKRRVFTQRRAWVIWYQAWGWAPQSWFSREARRLHLDFEREINDRIEKELLFGGKR